MVFLYHLFRSCMFSRMKQKTMPLHTISHNNSLFLLCTLSLGLRFNLPPYCTDPGLFLLFVYILTKI